MTKAELRKEYRRKRTLLTEADARTRNAGLLDHLLQYDWSNVRYLHTFLPIAGQREPDIWAFIENVQERHPQIQMVISRSEQQDCSMQHFLLTSDTELRENVWGIQEPVNGKQVDETLLDVVLVPLLVADKVGNRVGYGKGFYDRFLAKCRPDCQKIGVSLFEPVEKIDDVHPLDVPLDMLITPNGIIRFPTHHS